MTSLSWPAISAASAASRKRGRSDENESESPPPSKRARPTLPAFAITEAAAAAWTAENAQRKTAAQPLLDVVRNHLGATDCGRLLDMMALVLQQPGAGSVPLVVEVCGSPVIADTLLQLLGTIVGERRWFPINMVDLDHHDDDSGHCSADCERLDVFVFGVPADWLLCELTADPRLYAFAHTRGDNHHVYSPKLVHGNVLRLQLGGVAADAAAAVASVAPQALAHALYSRDVASLCPWTELQRAPVSLFETKRPAGHGAAPALRWIDAENWAAQASPAASSVEPLFELFRCQLGATGFDKLMAALVGLVRPQAATPSVVLDLVGPSDRAQEVLIAKLKAIVAPTQFVTLSRRRSSPSASWPSAEVNRLVFGVAPGTALHDVASPMRAEPIAVVHLDVSSQDSLAEGAADLRVRLDGVHQFLAERAKAVPAPALAHALYQAVSASASATAAAAGVDASVCASEC